MIIFLLLLSSLSYAQSLGDLEKLIKNNDIKTMEVFLEKLPNVFHKNYTLIHSSLSLHGSSYEKPRAILFNEDASTIISFNGDDSQAAGKMIELMTFDKNKRTYSFHEIEFSSEVKIHQNPAKCLTCHGQTPRPIWDHYNRWEGAYGSDDDRLTIEEKNYLDHFIATAKDHPRYQVLKNLEEVYRPSHSSVRYGMTERVLGQPNRFFTMKLYQQQFKKIADEIKEHSKFSELKPLIAYFTGKCYNTPLSGYGDGGNATPSTLLPNLLKTMKEGKHPNYRSNFNPEHALDYLFSKFQVKTDEWFLNSRNLTTYRVMKDGSDRTHEQWMARLLKDSEYENLLNFQVVDYQAIAPLQASLKSRESCEQLLSESIPVIKKFRLDLVDRSSESSYQAMTPTRICQGSFGRNCKNVYLTLPQICLSCHTQNQDPGILIPFQDFPEMAKKGDTALIEKMKFYIDNEFMPMRTVGDEIHYKKYKELDQQNLKKYLSDLLRR